MDPDTDILEMSKHYSCNVTPKLTMVDLGRCHICGVMKDPENFHQIYSEHVVQRNPNYSVIVYCDSCEEEAKKNVIIHAVSNYSFPSSPLKDIKIKKDNEEWDIFQLRVSKTLKPNALILLCKNIAGTINFICDEILEENREAFAKIRDIVCCYKNEYYPDEMREAFYIKLKELLNQTEFICSTLGDDIPSVLEAVMKLSLPDDMEYSKEYYDTLAKTVEDLINKGEKKVYLLFGSSVIIEEYNTFEEAMVYLQSTRMHLTLVNLT